MSEARPPPPPKKKKKNCSAEEFESIANLSTWLYGALAKHIRVSSALQTYPQNETFRRLFFKHAIRT